MGSKHEKIARAAYELYEKSGCLPGRDEENWLAAEKELCKGKKPAKRTSMRKKTSASAAPKKSKVKK
ncbi:MAG: DUF2934 domain-containing protein [Thermodesulfobacteriota bacterium]